MVRRIENETYNRTKPPYKDEANNVITFAFTRYHVPNTGTFNTLYTRLATAVSEKDSYKLQDVLSDLAEYKIGTRVNASTKQSEVVDVITQEPVE